MTSVIIFTIKHAWSVVGCAHLDVVVSVAVHTAVVSTNKHQWSGGCSHRETTHLVLLLF